MVHAEFPTSTPDLIAALHRLRRDNPKAVRDTVHIYPASLYCNDDELSDAGESSSAPNARARDRRIRSWKMTEHLYRRSDNQFPTLARGLFTEVIDEGDPVPPALQAQNDDVQLLKERIVARGYDKFFNIDEVAWTSWQGMKAHTRGPYYLTLKSNGCLILISALSPSHLLVSSKHSLGTTTESEQNSNALDTKMAALEVKSENSPDDVKGKGKHKSAEGEIESEDMEAQAHAAVGRRWLKQTLKRHGRSQADLASKLWSGNLTAVLELCDDDFEEHVIATPTHWTGLHLHGLNRNTPLFDTLPPDEVAQVAQEFGFIPTKYVTLNSLDEVKTFTDEVAKSGAWEGDMIEGFVVRTVVRQADVIDNDSLPPYPPGTPFFFKVKFEEPYLLYRTWREVTRVMLPLLGQTNVQIEEEVWRKVKAKNKRPEVAVYAKWCGEMMKAEPKLFDDYNRGVVRVRDRFLKWVESEGKEEWESVMDGKRKIQLGPASVVEIQQGTKKGKGKVFKTRDELKAERKDLPKKYMLVPIAVPGCGKTLIGLALSYLFDFGHTQSDDVTTKRSAPTFLRNIAELFKNNTVVYADRNNHFSKHYEELSNLAFDSATQKLLKGFDLHHVAIIWDVSAETLPYHRVLRICSERIIKRGDNHQTLRPDPRIESEHEAVVSQFLRKFTLPEEGLFDETITLSLLDSPREALGKVVDQLVKLLNLQHPSNNQLDAAIAAAHSYKVSTPYLAPGRIGKDIRYFGLGPEINLVEILQGILKSSPNDSAVKFFESLKGSNRVTLKPHVTLAHEKNVEAEKESNKNNAPDTIGEHERLWNQCRAFASSTSAPLFTFRMTHLVWDDRVMALILEDLHPQVEQSVKGFSLDLPDEIKQNLHVTVGTKSEEFQAFESRTLVGLAKSMIAQGEESGKLDEVIEGGGEVRWMKVQGISGEGKIKGMW